MFRQSGIFFLLILSTATIAQTVPPPTVQTPALPLRAGLILEPRAKHNLFKTLLVVNTTAWAADMATTQAGLLRGATELNPIFGPHPSPARLWGTSIALQSAFLYSCHLDRLHHPQGRFWKTMMTVSTALHAGAAVNNVVMIAKISH